MKERELEDIIIKYPGLIEAGLILKGRQVNFKGKVPDLLFMDRHGQTLIVELKIGVIRREHVGQIMDYAGSLLSQDDPTLRVMLVGNHVPNNLRRSLDHYGIEWKEIPFSLLKNFLHEKGDYEFLKYFSDQGLESELHPTVKRVNSQGTSGRKSGDIGYKWKIFFEQLLELSNRKIYIFRNKPTPVTDQTKFLGTSAGKDHSAWNYESRGGLRVELCFYHDDHRINKRRFQALQEKKREIEAVFGEPLNWEYKEGRKYQYIRSHTSIGGLKDEDKWPEIQEDLVNRMIRLERAMRDYIKALE